MVYLGSGMLSELVKHLQHELDSNGDHPVVISGAEATPTRIATLDKDGSETNDPKCITEYFIEG